MSKTIISKVIGMIKDIIQRTISKEVQEAKIFSVEMDTTQDISCQDQCSIIVRYALKVVVFEWLLFLVKAERATGEGLFKLAIALTVQLIMPNMSVPRCGSTYKRSC